MVEKQAATAESKGSSRLSIAKIHSIKSMVTGVLLGCLEVGGARVAAPVKATFPSASFMVHVAPCKRCHAWMVKT